MKAIPLLFIGGALILLGIGLSNSILPGNPSLLPIVALLRAGGIIAILIGFARLGTEGREKASK
jgi:hypothetical protein